MPELHETSMGQKLIQHTLPEIARQLERVANAMEKNTAADDKEKIEELYHFIEMTEALTYDQATAKRIQHFLTLEGVWKPKS